MAEAYSRTDATPRYRYRARERGVERKARKEGKGWPSLREEGQAIDTLTEPLMYVIDLLCDALALRVPDTLSSAPMLDVPNDGREGMERS